MTADSDVHLPFRDDVTETCQPSDGSARPIGLNIRDSTIQDSRTPAVVFIGLDIVNKEPPLKVLSGVMYLSVKLATNWIIARVNHHHLPIIRCKQLNKM